MTEVLPQEEEQELYGPWGQHGVPESITRLVLDWFVQAYDGFYTSPQFAALNEADKQYAYAAARSFVIMMLTETGETPSEWSQPAIEFAFEDLLAHDLPQSRGYEHAFVPVVFAFVTWMAEVGAIPHARQLQEWVRPYLDVGHERCNCAIRTEPLTVAQRVMTETGLNPRSLFDQAIYIAKYTATVCDEIDEFRRRAAEQPEPQTMLLNLLCHCGSGKLFDECCGGVN